VSREGYGFLAIVGLVGQRVVTLGVRPWSPSCIGKPELRAEKLGDETVFVEPAGFDTGCGNHSWESVWTLRDGDLHVAGHYPMRAGAGGDCGPPGYDSVSDEATVRYSGSKILLSGTTGTSKCTDADGGSICSKQSITWSESYGLRDGGIVQEPVPVGAPKRFFFPGEVPATPPPDPQAECAAGDLGACYRAGLVFAEDGWRQDAGRASRLFGRACDGGLAGGCFELGKLYSAGQGVKKSDARASQLWDRACTAGSLLACGSLGSAYDHGDGVTASPPRALELYTRACDGGELTGCLNLGVKYDRGDGVGKDSARAARLYDRACTGGQAVACFFLGLDYENGEGVTKDLRRSVALFEKGCEADARSCVALGVLYELGTVVQKDDARAFSLYETGCSSGVSSGCIDLAEAYADGRGAPKDEARAVALFKQGCTLEPASCFGLGLMYESGRGAPADRGRAIDLFRKGCASGDDWFCKRLDHLDASR